MNRDESQLEHKQGFDFHLQGRLSEAEGFYRSAIRLDPDFKHAWVNLGLTAFAGPGGGGTGLSAAGAAA